MKTFICYSIVSMILLSSYSCKKEQRISKEGILTIQDSLCIDIDYPYISNYSKFSAYTQQDTLFLVAYNHLTNSVDFINLSSCRISHSLQLAKEGDNMISNVAAIHCTESGILIKELLALKQISDKGEVTMSIPIHEISDSINNLYSICNKGVIISGYDNICYNKKQNRIIMPLIPLEDGTLENKYMGCEVDLNNLQFSFLKMAYPNDYKNRERLQGGYFIPHFSVMDENHILYNFYGDSRFWIYDIQTNKTTELNMPSNYTPNIVDYSKLPEKQKELVKEEYKSLRFREIHYIPELHYFARIHYAPKEEMSNKDTRKYLMLMSEDRQVVKEFILPLSFDGRYFIFNTDIFFFIRTDNPDNEIKLAKINLKPLCI